MTPADGPPVSSGGGNHPPSFALDFQRITDAFLGCGCLLAVVLVLNLIGYLVFRIL